MIINLYSRMDLNATTWISQSNTVLFPRLTHLTSWTNQSRIQTSQNHRRQDIHTRGGTDQGRSSKDGSRVSNSSVFYLRAVASSIDWKPQMGPIKEYGTDQRMNRSRYRTKVAGVISQGRGAEQRTEPIFNIVNSYVDQL